jgi:hypothetical protein
MKNKNKTIMKIKNLNNTKIKVPKKINILKNKILFLFKTQKFNNKIIQMIITKNKMMMKKI